MLHRRRTGREIVTAAAVFEDPERKSRVAPAGTPRRPQIRVCGSVGAGVSPPSAERAVSLDLFSRAADPFGVIVERDTDLMQMRGAESLVRTAPVGGQVGVAWAHSLQASERLGEAEGR